MKHINLHCSVDATRTNLADPRRDLEEYVRRVKDSMKDWTRTLSNATRSFCSSDVSVQRVKSRETREETCPSIKQTQDASSEGRREGTRHNSPVYATRDTTRMKRVSVSPQILSKDIPRL